MRKKKHTLYYTKIYDKDDESWDQYLINTYNSGFFPADETPTIWDHIIFIDEDDIKILEYK